MVKTVTLHCRLGNHEWERPSKRGRQPENCPEHKPAPGEMKRPLSDDAKVDKSHAYEKKRRENIEAILSQARHMSCKCGITPDMTDEQLKKLRSCTDPHYVCATLEQVHRIIGI